ncbi:flagellin [Hasllibacter halocynthiae]|uniref:Flagellin n=1 Tax=Hasllibacter halocynthiae TaxID=595589 RepID=A0A2T0X2Q4_9RHOB|nr:flagellin [Hasllibacter halocynthiae]PRY93220.1 flagellin [Hasllibacter halocynthiae]
MSSILTNTGAMTALQTLKSTNAKLADAQSQIATGKSVESAKDNAAVWAISKVMESDVAGFKAISESLSLGESTVAVARNGAETVTDLLTEIKGKIVASQEENVDRGKIQNDIDALTDQIKAVVGAAQFNGLNLLSGTEDVNVLSSLDRAGDGSVTASNITVNRQDLSTEVGRYGGGGNSLAGNLTAGAGTVGSAGSTVTLSATDAAGGSYSITLGKSTVTVAAAGSDADTEAAISQAINGLGLEGISATIDGGDVVVTSTRAFEDVGVSVAASGGAAALTADGGASATLSERAESVTFSASAPVNDGDSYRVTLGGTDYDYVAGKGETAEDVIRGLQTAIGGGGIEGVTTRAVQSDGAWTLKIDNAGADLGLAATGEDGGDASGGLFGLENIDVTTNAGADAALGTIETLIDSSISAAAEFGSAQGRIETQASFIGSLTDSLTAGIGSLVDADMEEASARLQALQVQQQLGVQALSIANQAPQSILSLFR